jgi:tetratricopeptide (TPR) repeat protein
LALLATLPGTSERTHQELDLQFALGTPLHATRGWGAPERARAFDRAFELSQQINETGHLIQALFMQVDICQARGEYQRALELGEQLLRQAQRSQDARYQMQAHYALGSTHYFRGELVQTRDHLEQGFTLYVGIQPHPINLSTGADLGVACLAYLALALQCLGYPDQASQRGQQALKLARELDRPFDLAFALAVACSSLYSIRHQVQPARARKTSPYFRFGGKSS